MFCLIVNCTVAGAGDEIRVNSQDISRAPLAQTVTVSAMITVDGQQSM